MGKQIFICIYIHMYIYTHALTTLSIYTYHFLKAHNSI